MMIFILILISLQFTTLALSCKLIDQCDQYGSCGNLASFSQLDTSGCVDNERFFVNLSNQKYVAFYPASPLILDNTLNLGKMIRIVIGEPNYPFGAADFYELKGIDFNLLTSFNQTLPIKFDFYKINFAIYNNGKPVDLSCDNTEWLNMFNYSANVLSIFGGKVVKIANSNFPTTICPTVFHMVVFETLKIQGSWIQFDSNDYPFLGLIDTSIKEVQIKYFNNLDLSNKTIHPTVFGNLIQFTVTIASIRKIQTNLFERLSKIRSVALHIINLKYFFHVNQIDWTHQLNTSPKNKQYFLNLSTEAVNYVFDRAVSLELHNNLNDQSLYPVEFFPYLEYKYPDEDFCLFASFPHENLVVPLLVSTNLTDCSCTMRWINYYRLFYQSVGFEPQDALGVIGNVRLYDSILICALEECNVTSFMNNCKIDSHVSYQASYFDLYDLRNTVLDLQSIMLDIIGPITAAISILANLGTIITIHYAPKKQNGPIQNQSVCEGLLYRYMFWNAFINLIYSTLYFFFYTIKCNQKSRTQYGLVADTCFQEQIYVNVVGSVLKLMSNFSFVQMCLNRFVLIGKEHNEKVVRVAHTRPRKFIGIIGLVSFVLSVVVYFNEQIFGSQTTTDGEVIYELYYYHDYYWNWYRGQKIKFKGIVNNKLNQLPVLSIFLFIHDFFSYFFYCFASSVIDALTVRNLRRVLVEKKNKSSVDHQDKARKSEIKSIIMIVLISFFNFTLRFPELFSTILFYNLLFNKQSNYIFKMLCFSYRECLPIVDMTNVFCILSLSLNFVFYVSFDNNFKVAFSHCLRKTCLNRRVVLK